MNAIASLFFRWIEVFCRRGTASPRSGRLAAGLALLAGLSASPAARAEVYAYNDVPNSTLFVDVCLDYYSAQYGNITSQFSSYAGTAALNYGDYIWITDEFYSDWHTESVESYTYYSCGSYHEYHEPEETWEPFDVVIYSISTNWSPDCGSVWEDESFTQTRENWEWHLVGEISNLGNERNTRWDFHSWEETQSAQGCRSLNWQSFNDVVADWHEVSNDANCSSVWEDQNYTYHYTEERTRRVGWRNDRDGVTNSEDVTDGRSGSRSESGCKPLNWRSFEEITEGWHAVSDWSPSPSGTWEDQSCSQSRTLSRTRRTGERNDRGDERNVSNQTDTDTEDRSVSGTRPLNWHTFQEVLSGWQEVSRSPTPSGVWEDTQFTQVATDERSIRTGEENDRGDTRNVQTSTETRQRNIEGVWGARPLNWHFWENRLMRDWYDLGAWAPALNTRFFWEDVAQSLGQLQDWAEWEINDRGNSRLVRVFLAARTLSRTLKGTKVPGVSAFDINLPLGGGSVRVGVGGGSVTLPNGTVITGSVGGAGSVAIPASVIPGGVTVNTSGGTIAVTTSSGTSTVGTGGSVNVGGVVVTATSSGNATVTFPGGPSIAVGPGGGSIALPGGTSVSVATNGRINVQLPPGAPSVLAKAVDLAGAIYNAGAGHIISVRSVLTGIIGPLPSNPLLDLIDLGVTATGIVQVGLRQGSDGPYVWAPVYLTQVPPSQIAVDANRDGAIAFGGADVTASATPFRFWLNDDDDVDDDDPDDAENAPVSSADWLDDKIDGIRDLEDFSRLKINLSGIQDAVRQGQMRIALEWKSAPGYTGSPGIKLWRNLSPNGGTEYLSNVNVAQQHLALREPGTIQGALRYVIPTQYWTDVGLSASQPYGNLLFEGISAGKDQLVIKLLNADGAEIGEGGGVWLELKNIKSMYERAKATANGAEDLPFPYNYVGTNSVSSPTMAWTPDPAGYQFEPAQGETQTYIVAVHGWNQTYERSVMYAETMFKRLWHRGYKGRFVGFRWPTFTGLSSYNDSEYRAWKCGVSLKQYLSSLPSGYTVNLVAHSMGNIVVGSALEKGAAVANYALLNAAVPAICYDTSGTVVQTGWGYVTPNDDPDSATVALSYQGRLANVSGNLVNFFLAADSALSAWEINNDSPDGGRYPVAGARPHQWPEGAINAGYRYQRTAPAGQKLRVVRVAGERILSSADEAMGFAVQAPSLTVGADGRTRGAIDEWVDMNTYGFGSAHSAEFLFSIQQTREFYAELLLKLRVTTQP